MRTAVVGGGASGMMAAGTAAALGEDVTIFEHSDRLGLKLGITGKGRCNVTNDCTVSEFMRSVPVNGRFLYAALTAFPPSETMRFFEELGVPLKTERGERVFPVSDRAGDIVRAMKRYASGCAVIHESVKRLIFSDAEKKQVSGVARVSGVGTDRGEYAFDRVIICTGGLSYPSTGSRGGGYELARQAGHTIIPCRPSLVPLETYENWCAELQGLSLKNISAVFREKSNGKILYEDFGEIMFTHFGLSGPVILSASAHLRGVGPGDCEVSIDLKPALDEKTLDARLLSDFAKYSNRDFMNSLGDLLPQKLIPVAVELSGIDGRRKTNGITREERAAFLRLLKNLTLTIRGPRPVEEAVVTSGGVSVKEIDPKTMRSKLAEGLYFAGEVIDTDAYTGGFNLQIAFSTGYAAGRGAADPNEI